MNLTIRRILSSSLFFWIFLSLVGAYYVYNIKKYVSFGIDLVGGTYLTLEVDVNKAIETDLLDDAVALNQQLTDSKSEPSKSIKMENGKAILTFAGDADAVKAVTMLGNKFRRADLAQSGNVLALSYPEDVIEEIKRYAVESNIKVLHSRLDEFSVAEIQISQQGDKRIIVELPDIKNPELAKQRIGKTALLEMKYVESIAGSEEKLLENFGGIVPEGMIILKGSRRQGEIYYLVPQAPDITGKLLKDAKVSLNEQGFTISHGVEVQFNPEGAEKFYQLTKKSIGKPVAIILDGVVISDPVPSSAIKGGNAIITFGEGMAQNQVMKEAQELAGMLKAGSFVAPVKFVEERTIGPSLGHESIRQGLIACAISMALLLIFSILFYKMSGLFAFIVLIYNLLLILLGLIWLRATLTLPGIAGMVLTIGMAIDSSILIYERIREELATGTSFKKAVDIGFSGAMAVILDANITTFIVGLVLYFMGTGPIKGFAVTMMLGIGATLITGLLMLRSIFTFAIDELKAQKISI